MEFSAGAGAIAKIMSRDHIIPPQHQVDSVIEKMKNSVGGMDPSVVNTAASIHRFAANVLSGFDKHFQRYGLSQPGFLILISIYTSPGKIWTATELADIVKVKAPTMTGILDTIEKEGYIAREAHPSDRRKNIIVMTDKGKKKMKKILPDHFSRLQQAFGVFISDTKREELGRIFKDISDAMDSFTAD